MDSILRRRFTVLLGLIEAGAVLVVAFAGCSGASTPPTTTTTPSSTGEITTSPPSAANVQGDFVSLLADGHTRLALSTDGLQVIAYACDGDDANAPTFAPWFIGSVSDNSVELVSTTDGYKLQATLTPQNASGTITLKEGTTLAFTAEHLTTADNEVGSGLYRGQATFNGERYLAGWIVDKPEPNDIPRQGRAIVNQQTREFMNAPQLEEEDISAKHVPVPYLVTFPLAKCHLGTCS